MAAAESTPLTEEPTEWLDLDDFSPGLDTNRAAATHHLAGSAVTIVTDDGTLSMTFDRTGTVLWEAHGFSWADSGSDVYEEVPVGDGAYWIDFSLAERRVETVTAVVHPSRGWALVVHSRVHDESDRTETRVMQTFHAGTVLGAAGDAQVPAPSRDLIGKRTLFRYSPNHLYEHIYLSSRRFAWHNLIGDQRGHAATELTTTYKLDEGLYLFTWREERILVGTVFVFDYAGGRSTGKVLGVKGDGTVINTPGGALIIPFGASHYADFQEPV